MLPVFCSARQLAASSSWLDYLQFVYGADDGNESSSSFAALAFPLDTRGLALFYAGAHLPSDILAAGGAAARSGFFDPANNATFGALYTHDMHAGLPLTYMHAFGGPAADGTPAPATRLLLVRGLRSGTRVEVRHRCCDTCGLGYWMTYSPGSGVYYQLGRTVAFADRAAACRFFELYPKINCSRLSAGRKHVASAKPNRRGEHGKRSSIDSLDSKRKIVPRHPNPALERPTIMFMRCSPLLGLHVPATARAQAVPTNGGGATGHPRHHHRRPPRPL